MIKQYIYTLHGEYATGFVKRHQSLGFYRLWKSPISSILQQSWPKMTWPASISYPPAWKEPFHTTPPPSLQVPCIIKKWAHGKLWPGHCARVNRSPGTIYSARLCRPWHARNHHTPLISTTVGEMPEMEPGGHMMPSGEVESFLIFFTLNYSQRYS